MKSSILESEKTLNNAECLLHSKPSRGIIRTTADYFLLPFIESAAKEISFRQIPVKPIIDSVNKLCKQFSDLPPCLEKCPNSGMTNWFLNALERKPMLSRTTLKKCLKDLEKQLHHVRHLINCTWATLSSTSKKTSKHQKTTKHHEPKPFNPKNKKAKKIQKITIFF
jgi:hypothetical protein